jgi:hypothetical protein
MDVGRLEKYEARAKIIKALAHPTRLLIVDELVTHTLKATTVCLRSNERPGFPGISPG